jgi:hypothetical protein
MQTFMFKTIALPVGDWFAHFTVGGLAPLHNRHIDYTPTVLRQFYMWDHDCNVMEKSGFAILPRPIGWPVRSSTLSTTAGIPLEAEHVYILSTLP